MEGEVQSDSNIKHFIYFDYDEKNKCLINIDPKLVYTKEDKYYIQNVIEKKIISDEFYPVLELGSKDSVRSIDFVKDHVKRSSVSLDTEDRLRFLIALRDLFMYHVLEGRKNKEISFVFEKINISTPEDEMLLIDDFYPISFYPSKSFQVVRFIERDALDDSRFCLYNTKRVVFMRKYDLTYYNFENILVLDDDLSLLKSQNVSTFHDSIESEEREYLGTTLDHFNICPECYENNSFDHKKGNDEDESRGWIKCKTYSLKEVNHIDDVYLLKFNKEIGEYLLELDKKNYYIKPFNDDQRGGLRFIFNSIYLATYLTKVIKELVKFSDDQQLISTFKNFKKVNNAFRFNKFLKNDDIFKNHFDISYVDKENKEYSLYTLVIYLKTNKDKISLKIEDRDYKFENFDCVIFNQSKQHEGYTYDDKIFIRTDLIFHVEDDELDFSNQELSKVFNQACYISLKSIFQPALKKYSSDLFHQFSLMKYKSLQLVKKKDYYFNKKYDLLPTTFLTNGYNYFFPYCGNITIKQYILMILHDYFSAYFIDPIEDLENVNIHDSNDFQKLSSHFKDCKCKCTFKKRGVQIIENGMEIDYAFIDKVTDCSFGLVDKSDLKVEKLDYAYCTACFYENYNPIKDPNIYKRHLNENIFPIKNHCHTASMFKLDKIQVVKNRVYFFTDRRVHFAACVSGYICSSRDFITKEAECDVIVPKNNVFIDFSVVENVIVFNFDFFKNNVIFKHKIEKDVSKIEGYRYYDSLNNLERFENY